MNTPNGAAPRQDQTNRSLPLAPFPQQVEAKRPQPKTGIGGCLLYPLILLIAQPFMIAYLVFTASRPRFGMTYRIYWPYLIYDLLLLGAVAVLLVFFLRKKAALPALFVLFLVSFSILSGLLANALWRLPEARVAEATMGNPLWSHFVMLIQSLLLIPYFALDVRVKNTFTRALDDRGLLDRLVQPIASPAEWLYGWLASRGKMVFVYAFAFVIGVFILDLGVDSIVLNFFLR